MTATSGARAARCIWPLIPWAACWRCRSRPPMRRIGSRSRSWLRPCRKQPGKRSRSPTSIRATRGCRSRGGHASGHRPGRRQAGGGHARLCLAAPPMGCGALLCLGHTLSAARQGLRTTARSGRRPVFSRLRKPDAQTPVALRRSKSITGSRQLHVAPTDDLTVSWLIPNSAAKLRRLRPSATAIESQHARPPEFPR